jgi:hypothetical protein
MAVVLGDVIRLPSEEEEEEEEEKEAKEGGNASAVVPEADALLGLVVCLFEEEGEKMAQVCVMCLRRRGRRWHRCFWRFVLFVFVYAGCAAGACGVLPV